MSKKDEFEKRMLKMAIELGDEDGLWGENGLISTYWQREAAIAPAFKTETDKSEYIPDLFPHYTSNNPAHRDAYGFLAFGEPVKGMSHEYLDRICQWDREASQRAYDEMVTRCPEGVQLYNFRRTAAYWEQWLSVYYGKPVTLHCIYSGLQAFNGYWWNSFGYTIHDGESA